MVGLAESAYDLRFRLLGVPVRIHPFFWLVSAIMGFQSFENDIPAVLLWMAAVFVSILVHEFGHALMSKAFNCSPSVVLWGMGGLCYSQGEQQTPRQRLAVIFAGPGAGFLLCGLVVMVFWIVLGISPVEQARWIAFQFRICRQPRRLRQEVCECVRLAPQPGAFRLQRVLVPGADQSLLGARKSFAYLAFGRRASDADSAHVL